MGAFWIRPKLWRYSDRTTLCVVKAASITLLLALIVGGFSIAYDDPEVLKEMHGFSSLPIKYQIVAVSFALSAGVLLFLLILGDLRLLTRQEPPEQPPCDWKLRGRDHR